MPRLPAAWLQQPPVPTAGEAVWLLMAEAVLAGRDGSPLHPAAEVVVVPVVDVEATIGERGRDGASLSALAELVLDPVDANAEQSAPSLNAPLDLVVDPGTPGGLGADQDRCNARSPQTRINQAFDLASALALGLLPERSVVPAGRRGGVDLA